jgi:hypothetical protein
MPEVKLTQEEYNKMLRKMGKPHTLGVLDSDKWEWWERYFAEKEVDKELENFIENVRDVLAEARVVEPAGRGDGYSIEFDEPSLKGYALALCERYLEIQDDK